MLLSREEPRPKVDLSTSEYPQCLVVTGNSIVLWTRFKGFDSLNLSKAEFPIGET